jgi:hypothetical protein
MYIKLHDGWLKNMQRNLFPGRKNFNAAWPDLVGCSGIPHA